MADPARVAGSAGVGVGAVSKLHFTLGPPLGHRATFGLIVLRSDETVEAEARRMLAGEGLAHYVSRVPCQPHVTNPLVAAIAAMQALGARRPAPRLRLALPAGGVAGDAGQAGRGRDGDRGLRLDGGTR